MTFIRLIPVYRRAYIPLHTLSFSGRLYPQAQFTVAWPPILTCVKLTWICKWAFWTLRYSQLFHVQYLDAWALPWFALLEWVQRCGTELFHTFPARPVDRKCCSVQQEDSLRPFFKAIVYSKVMGQELCEYYYNIRWQVTLVLALACYAMCSALQNYPSFHTVHGLTILMTPFPHVISG